MSTQPVAPDSSNLASAVAPQVTMPPQAAPQFPPATPQTPTQAPATSRLQAVLQAVSSVDTSQPSPKDVNPQPSTLSRAVSTGLSAVGAGIAGAANQKGRASFAGGMTGGANAELQQQAMDQDVKFKSMDDQIRLAELHNQDIKLQNDTQAQTDAHIKAELDNRSLANDLGIDFDTIANHGGAVMDHLAAQTAANGSATVPPGTHVSADGDTIYIPTDTQKTRDGQMAMYTKLAPALGLPSLPEGAQFVPSKLMNIFTNKINGFALNGDPINHDALPALIASTQTQRDNLAKNGGNEVQLKTLDNLLGIYKANLNALDEHAATVTKNNAQSKKSGEIAAQLTPEGQALDQRNQANKIAAQDNAAANRPQKPTNNDWVSGVSADEKKKAELAENMTFNANNIASTLMRRPDLVGTIAGRYTSVKQMAGTNDPDIVSLATDIHNIAMANNGIHGMRSAEAVTEFENKLLNNFKNGPQGIAGGLKASTDSVQTFIDNARPSSYKTHSSQGGAVRAMVPQAQGQ